jgi:predicted ATP-binding protein involved in virulence
MDEKHCFVIMGFGTKTDLATGRKLNLDKSYQLLIKPAVESKGLQCYRADDIKHSDAIDMPIYKQLLAADVVIADISTANPNTLYELGVRHALRPRTTIVMSEDQLSYPFDTSHMLIYQYTHLGENIDYLEVLRFQKLLGETLDNVLQSDEPDSPVYLFLNDLIPPSSRVKAGQMAKQLSDAMVEIGGMEELFKEAKQQLSQRNLQIALKYINQAIEIDDEKTNSDENHFPHPELYELKARILTAVGDTAAVKPVLDRYEELSDENKYRFNLSKKIKIERVVIENLPFFGTFTWNFTPGLNILLGKNGYGKSHLLRLLTALLYNDKQKIREWISPTASISARAKLYIESEHPVDEAKLTSLKLEMEELLKQPSSVSTEKRIDELKEGIDAEQRRILATKEGITGNIGKIPILAIPDSRFFDRSQSVVSNSKTAAEDLKRDGATDFLRSTPFGPIISKGLFIVAQQNLSDFSQEPYNLIQRVISELAQQRQVSGAFALSSSSNSKPYFKFIRIESTSTTGDYKIYVQSEENKDEVTLNNISQGTFSILAICLMIYRFLHELHPNSTNPLLESAIVIIDEVDAHLHPSWEQKIIGLLRREFPNVQFLITAHSPLVVAGCLEKEVSIIRHNRQGFSLEQCTENFIGYSTSELLQRVFEIEDKDEQYLLYSSMAGKEEELQEKVTEIEDLKKESKISLEQTQELDHLYQTLNYIDQVKEIQAEQAHSSSMETEHIVLQEKVRFLENKLSETK